MTQTGFDTTGAFFALSALAGQFDILNETTKAVQGSLSGFASTSQLKALSSGMVKVATDVGILGFALKSLGVAFTKEALMSEARGGKAGGFGKIAGQVAVVGLAAFTASKALAALIDASYDYAARQKQLTETIKAGDVAQAVEDAESLNVDIAEGNKTKTAGGALAGAGAGALVGLMLGGPIGAGIGALIGGLVGGFTGFFSGLDAIQIKEVKLRAESFKALKDANALEEDKKTILNDVTKSETARAQQAAVLSLQQIRLHKESESASKRALESAKARGAEEEEITNLEGELANSTEQLKQRMEAQRVEVLNQVTALAGSNLAFKTLADVTSKLTPAQQDHIDKLGITNEELANTTNVQLSLNKQKVHELRLMAKRLVIEARLQKSLSNVQASAAGFQDFANKIQGTQTFDVGSSAVSRGSKDPGFAAGITQGGQILGQQDLAKDIIAIEKALQKAPQTLADSIEILATETETAIQEAGVDKLFDQMFAGVTIQDPDLKDEFDRIKGKFKEVLTSGDANAIEEAQKEFHKALETLGKNTKERIDLLGKGLKSYEQQLSTYSSLLDERNKQESDYLTNLSAYRDTFFQRSDRISELRGRTVTRTDVRQRTERDLAGRGFAGRTGMQLAAQEGLLRADAKALGGGVSNKQQVQRQKDLEAAANKTGLALQEYIKGLEKQGEVIETQIEKEKSLTAARRGFSEQFVFGSNEQKKTQLQNIRNTQIAAGQGNLYGANEQQKQGILSVLKQFENAPIFQGGQTGAQVQGEIMGNELLQAGLINIDQYGELVRGISSKEDQLIDDLSGIYREQNQIAKVTLDLQSLSTDIFAGSVNKFGLAVENLKLGGGAGKVQKISAGGIIYADEGTLVNFKPKGTDTVPAMLTPGEFVVKKSSVDKYGVGMMKNINDGNYAGGGIVNYLANGGQPSLMAFEKKSARNETSEIKELRKLTNAFEGPPDGKQYWTDNQIAVITPDDFRAAVSGDLTVDEIREVNRMASTIGTYAHHSKQYQSTAQFEAMKFAFGPASDTLDRTSGWTSAETATLRKNKEKRDAARAKAGVIPEMGPGSAHEDRMKAKESGITNALSDLVIEPEVLASQAQQAPKDETVKDYNKLSYKDKEDYIAKRTKEAQVRWAEQLKTEEAEKAEWESRPEIVAGHRRKAEAEELEKTDLRFTRHVSSFSEFINLLKSWDHRIAASDPNKKEILKLFNSGINRGLVADKLQDDLNRAAMSGSDIIKTSDFLLAGVPAGFSAWGYVKQQIPELTQKMKDSFDKSDEAIMGQHLINRGWNEIINKATPEELNAQREAARKRIEETNAPPVVDHRTEKEKEDDFISEFSSGFKSETGRISDSYTSSERRKRQADSRIEREQKTQDLLADWRAEEERQAEVEAASRQSEIEKIRAKETADAQKDQAATDQRIQGYLSQSINLGTNMATFIEKNDQYKARADQIYNAARDSLGPTYDPLNDTNINTYGINEAQWILNGLPDPAGYDLPSPNHAFLLNQRVSVLTLKQKRFWYTISKLKNRRGRQKYTNTSSAIQGYKSGEAQRLYNRDTLDNMGEPIPFPTPFNTGGPVGGVAGTDANPAMLTRGEYVINKQSAQAIGANNLNSLNSIKGYNEGGTVGYFATGGSPLSGHGASPGRPLSSSALSLLAGKKPVVDLNADDFSSSMNKLVGGEGFGAFSDAVEKFNKIPKDLTMTLAPTNITISLNGAELLAQMMPIIQSEILNVTAAKIEDLKTELKSGNV